MATTALPATTPASTVPVNATRAVVTQALAEHHTATIALGGGLYVWACHCGAHAADGATDHTTAYNDARDHTAQAVLDALTAAGAL